METKPDPSPPSVLTLAVDPAPSSKPPILSPATWASPISPIASTSTTNRAPLSEQVKDFLRTWYDEHRHIPYKADRPSIVATVSAIAGYQVEWDPIYRFCMNYYNKVRSKAKRVEMRQNAERAKERMERERSQLSRRMKTMTILFPQIAPQSHADLQGLYAETPNPSEDELVIWAEHVQRPLDEIKKWVARTRVLDNKTSFLPPEKGNGNGNGNGDQEQKTEVKHESRVYESVKGNVKGNEKSHSGTSMYERNPPVVPSTARMIAGSGACISGSHTSTAPTQARSNMRLPSTSTAPLVASSSTSPSSHFTPSYGIGSRYLPSPAPGWTAFKADSEPETDAELDLGDQDQDHVMDSVTETETEVKATFVSDPRPAFPVGVDESDEREEGEVEDSTMHDELEMDCEETPSPVEEDGERRRDRESSAWHKLLTPTSQTTSPVIARAGLPQKPHSGIESTKEKSINNRSPELFAYLHQPLRTSPPAIADMTRSGKEGDEDTDDRTRRDGESEIENGLPTPTSSTSPLPPPSPPTPSVQEVMHPLPRQVSPPNVARRMEMSVDGDTVSTTRFPPLFPLTTSTQVSNAISDAEAWRVMKAFQAQAQAQGHIPNFAQSLSSSHQVQNQSQSQLPTSRHQAPRRPTVVTEVPSVLSSFSAPALHHVQSSARLPQTLPLSAGPTPFSDPEFLAAAHAESRANYYPIASPTSYVNAAVHPAQGGMVSDRNFVHAQAQAQARMKDVRISEIGRKRKQVSLPGIVPVTFPPQERRGVPSSPNAGGNAGPSNRVDVSYYPYGMAQHSAIAPDGTMRAHIQHPSSERRTSAPIVQNQGWPSVLRPAHTSLDPLMEQQVQRLAQSQRVDAVIQDPLPHQYAQHPNVYPNSQAIQMQSHPPQLMARPASRPSAPPAVAQELPPYPPYWTEAEIHRLRQQLQAQKKQDEQEAIARMQAQSHAQTRRPVETFSSHDGSVEREQMQHSYEERRDVVVRRLSGNSSLVPTTNRESLNERPSPPIPTFTDVLHNATVRAAQDDAALRHATVQVRGPNVKRLSDYMLHRLNSVSGKAQEILDHRELFHARLLESSTSQMHDSLMDLNSLVFVKSEEYEPEIID